METYDNALVSVIVPVFKVEQYIQRCLDSICNQTYKNLEIILIDDGSPDRSGEICDEYARKDKRIKVIHKQNAGVSAARNDGLDIATGDFITFVDSDDYIAPEMYQTLVKKIVIENADIAICSFFQEGISGEFHINSKVHKEVQLSQIEQIECLLRNRYYTCALWDKLYRKAILKNIRFDVKVHHYEDYLFLYDVMKKSRKAIFIPNGYYYYCNNEQSTARRPFNSKMMEIVEVCKRVLENVHFEFPSLVKIAEIEFVRNNIMCAILAKNAGCNDKLIISQLQCNIRKYLGKYLFGYAAVGYKVYALAISTNWKIFARL